MAVYGPPPSRLVFLSDIPRMNPGDKVRFLGCVESYTVSNATLTLKHAYPSTSSAVLAHVDISHVLDSAKSSDLQTGAWLNIIGYVAAAPEQRIVDVKGARADRKTEREAHVQAVVIWNTGDLKIDAYEKAVEARKEADTLVKPA